MKIKGRLVFDKHSGKLIGFTSLGDSDLDFSTFDEQEVATHVLAFMAKEWKQLSNYACAFPNTSSGVLPAGPNFFGEQ